MIYYFTLSDFKKFWENILGEDHNTMSDRLTIWNKYYQQQYKLQYSESDKFNEEGFFGTLVGNEKDINWFILKEL